MPSTGEPKENRALTFQLAFTLALAGIVFCAAGVVGYNLGMRALLLAENRWVDDVIWWQIYFGIGFAVSAAYFARTADRIARRGK